MGSHVSSIRLDGVHAILPALLLPSSTFSLIGDDVYLSSCSFTYTCLACFYDSNPRRKRRRGTRKVPELLKATDCEHNCLIRGCMPSCACASINSIGQIVRRQQGRTCTPAGPSKQLAIISKLFGRHITAGQSQVNHPSPRGRWLRGRWD